MLTDFFFTLRRARVPVSITEYLTLLEGLDRHVAGLSIDNFYFFARLSLVKDERHYDRFDLAFGHYFKGAQERFDTILGSIPEDWLRRQAELMLSEEEKRRVEALGGLQELLETLKKRLQEQRDRHQGGNKWIGTAGRSPFGAYGFNPEGVRIGQSESRQRRAVKVWDQREFRNFDDGTELGTRNIKVALRKLRRFARDGAEEELDLDDTIRATARNGGMLDLKLVRERRNAVKVLLFLDVGGSMDDHVQICERLFSAARTEFKHLEYFYFHNCVYESVWKDNRRRHAERTPLLEVMRTYGRDYRLIVVGDATMSPYEITQPGGSVEHLNQEPGAAWLTRLLEHYPRAVWLNPQPQRVWQYTASIELLRKICDDRMYPLTLAGLDQAIRMLRRKQ